MSASRPLAAGAAVGATVAAGAAVGGTAVGAGVAAGVHAARKRQAATARLETSSKRLRFMGLLLEVQPNLGQDYSLGKGEVVIGKRQLANGNWRLASRS